MSAPLAVADALHAVPVLAAAGAAGLALVLRSPRGRAMAMLAAPLLAVGALASLNVDAAGDQIAARPALAAVGAAVGLALLVALAVLFLRRPAWFALAALAALPFRIPLSTGDTSASLLLPLYGVIGAGVLAYAIRRLRRGDGTADEPERHPRLRPLSFALAAMIVVYGAQSLYSTDVEQAAKNVCLFYVPFALLYGLLLDVPWSARLVRHAFTLVCGLALVFVLVGFVEYATGRLLLSNPKVIEANELKPYFRVNSLFFDPNIYGRFVALTMTGLAAWLLWSRRPRDGAIAAPLLAVLWAGLVLSLSQSSFAALLVGLGVVAALRWRPGPVLAATAAAGAAALAVLFLAPGLVGLDSRSERGLDRATSGRATLTSAGARMARDRPVWGFGSGSFAERYEARENPRSTTAAMVSHTTPLTIAAEQGVIGVAAYLALLWTAFALLFSGLRGALRAAAPPVAAVARAALAAAFAGLVLHTLVYASFLEDPLAWVLLAVSAALGAALRAREGGAEPVPAVDPVPADPPAAPVR